MERGLSENTLVSYRTDLSKLLTWMEQNNYRLDFSLSGLQDYQSWLVDADFKQTSRARMLSAIVVCSNTYIVRKSELMIRVRC
ncbi:site-specific integrase [Vibrio chagasii]|nr:site-specific integrase [Vibrio chagasii]